MLIHCSGITLKRGMKGTKESSVDSFEIAEREKNLEGDILNSVSLTSVADCLLGISI